MILKKRCLIFTTTPPQLMHLKLDKNFMPKLNEYNSKIVENCIGDSKAKKTFLDSLDKAKYVFHFTNADVKEIITAIAAENKTRTPQKSIDMFAEFIMDTKNNFWDRLKAGCSTLPDDLYNYVKRKANRKEKSLASKICRYLNDWVYNQMHYTVNDSFARGVLPYYLSLYNVDKDEWSKKVGKGRILKTFEDDEKPYETFIIAFKQLSKKVSNLTIHQIDHLLWYCFSNDGIRFELAKGIAIKKANE